MVKYALWDPFHTENFVRFLRGFCLCSYLSLASRWKQMENRVWANDGQPESVA